MTESLNCAGAAGRSLRRRPASDGTHEDRPPLPGIDTDDSQVVACLFVQGYVHRILMVAVAWRAAAGVIPDSAAQGWSSDVKGTSEGTAICSRPAPCSVAGQGVGLSPAAVEAAVLFVRNTAVQRDIAPLT